MSKHSKWPIFMRMHGSIMPEMVLPLIFVACWSTLITCISKFVHNLGTSNLLLTVLGFVVGLGLSFRSSTAYERYAEGRKYWSQLTLSAHNLARVFWIHGLEREGEQGKQDLLAKMTALNLVVAFAVSLKHKLRFEPYSGYDDLAGLVGHLDTYAKAATTPETVLHQKSGTFKAIGEYLGLSFAESNPRKLLKKANKPLGNLPLEVLTYLASYIDETVEAGLLKIPMQQTLACKSNCSHSRNTH
jgi:putative membrane protein